MAANTANGLGLLRHPNLDGPWLGDLLLRHGDGQHAIFVAGRHFLKIHRFGQKERPPKAAVEPPWRGSCRCLLFRERPGSAQRQVPFSTSILMSRVSRRHIGRQYQFVVGLPRCQRGVQGRIRRSLKRRFIMSSNPAATGTSLRNGLRFRRVVSSVIVLSPRMSWCQAHLHYTIC